MDTMVLEKQDSGISMSTIGIDGNDGKMGETSSPSMEHIHKLENGHIHIELDQDEAEYHHHRHDEGRRHRDDGHHHLDDGQHHHDDGYRLLDDGHHDGHKHHNDPEQSPDGAEHVPLHKTVCCSLCRKKQERQERLRRREERTAHRSSQDSINDATSVTSSRASRAWIRDPLADAKPVTDPVLRQKIQGMTGSATKLSSRGPRSHDGTAEKHHSMPVMRSSDQKILQLMIAKRESERKQQEKRDSVRSRWEEERRRETAAKTAAENQRRSMVEKRKTSSLSCLHHTGNGPCSCGRNHDRPASATPRTPKSPSPHHGHPHTLSADGDTCKRSWVTASQKRLELQKQQLQEKKMREMERKKSVEKRLEDQKRETEEYQRKLREKQERDTEKAEAIRTGRTQQKELNRRLKHMQSEQRYRDNTDSLKRQSMEDLAAMKATIELRGNLSEGKHKDLSGRKEHEHKRRSVDLDERLRQYRVNKTRQDEEVQQWHEELLSYRQSQETRAEQQAKQQAIAKAKRTHEARRTRERLQRENMKKLLSSEEEWKAEVEANIALKDSKTKMLQREKEEVIQQSRAMAQASQQLREDLRQHYSLNDLDKLNRQAELEARINARSLQSATTNLARLEMDI